MRSEMTVNRDWCNGGQHEVAAGVMLTQLEEGWTCPVCVQNILADRARFLAACGVEG